jgi:hypothetical protein
MTTARTHRVLRTIVRGAALFATTLPLVASAQFTAHLGPATRSGEPRLMGGASFTVAQPAGQFGQYVNNGVGANVHGLARIGGSGWFALRADASFIQYGNESKRVPLSTTVGGRIQVDLTTSNNIFNLAVGPQIMAPSGPVRPYVNGSVGFSYFGTESSVKGRDDDLDFARTTNFHDEALSFGGGTGVLIPVAQGKRTLVFLDLGARFINNGSVRYLREGGIQDLPNGDVKLNVINSTANLWTYHVGVSIGGR